MIDSDKSSALLEGFGTQTFNFLELLSVYKWSILLSPFNDIFSPVSIQSCNVSERKVYRIHLLPLSINVSAIHYKDTCDHRKSGLQNLKTTKRFVNRLKAPPEKRSLLLLLWKESIQVKKALYSNTVLQIPD